MPSSRRNDGPSPRLVLLDNHDSFTWNLVQAFGALGAQVDVLESDVATIDDVAARRPGGVVISPGPGAPGEAGISGAVVRRFGASIPVLGVCLGHQVIGAAFGAPVLRAAHPVHGRTTPIFHRGEGVLRGLPDGFAGMRYHSLLLDRLRIPGTLRCTAWTAEGEIMAISHRHLPIEGIQFHPESILTTVGSALLANFLASVVAHDGAALGHTA